MIEPIGEIETALPEKFGVPRQSGLVPELLGHIRLYAPYNQPAYLKGIADFDYLWLIWSFSKVPEKINKATVRPPRLGGNTSVGVFASRSPFRPNRLGLSAVKLLAVNEEADGTVTLTVSGVDMVSGTPIYDIKPYIPYADSYPKAAAGFVDEMERSPLIVESSLAEHPLTDNQYQQLVAILAQDPRPTYQKEPMQVYGLSFETFNVRFTVNDHIVTIVSIEK